MLRLPELFPHAVGGAVPCDTGDSETSPQGSHEAGRGRRGQRIPRDISYSVAIAAIAISYLCAYLNRIRSIRPRVAL
jgi:hypothetical protein